MRGFGQFVLALCACGTFLADVPGAGGQIATPEERAARVLPDARAALGGENRLIAVKTVTTTGRTQRVQGDNLVPIEFEMLVELPDKYLRKDEIPAQESDPTTTGFNGGVLIQVPPPSPPPTRAGIPAPPPGAQEKMLEQRALNARQDFAADARDVCHVVRGLPADVQVPRSGRSTAGQGTCARSDRISQLYAPFLRQYRNASAGDGVVDGARPADASGPRCTGRSLQPRCTVQARTFSVSSRTLSVSSSVSAGDNRQVAIMTIQNLQDEVTVGRDKQATAADPKSML